MMFISILLALLFMSTKDEYLSMWTDWKYILVLLVIAIIIDVIFYLKRK